MRWDSLSIPRNTRYFPSKDLTKANPLFREIWNDRLYIKKSHVLKPDAAAGSRSCPAWEYLPVVRTWDCRRASLPCGFPPTAGANTEQQQQQTGPVCAFWRRLDQPKSGGKKKKKILAQQPKVWQDIYHALSHFLFTLHVMKPSSVPVLRSACSGSRSQISGG